MTYLVYCAWIASVLMVGGALDELVVRRFRKKVEAELAPPAIWWMGGVVSLFLPGSGQFVNRQPVKALLVVLWPFLVGFAWFPRPWQLVRFKFYQMLMPWYLIVMLDALLIGALWHFRVRRPQAAPAGGGYDLGGFLARRQGEKK